MTLETVKNDLRQDGLTEDEIEAKMYFDFTYFTKRVPRCVPPPSSHYWRVRGVLIKYGNSVDKKTGMPLFKQAA